LVGYLLGKGWDGRWMLVFGFTVASFAFFGYAHMTLESGTWDIFWVQIMQGTGMAFLFVPLTPLTMSAVLKQEMSYATSCVSPKFHPGSAWTYFLNLETTLEDILEMGKEHLRATDRHEYDDSISASSRRTHFSNSSF
jgi:hypothetical protein